MGERILKIGQHLAKLEAKMQWFHFFSTRCTCCYNVTLDVTGRQRGRACLCRHSFGFNFLEDANQLTPAYRAKRRLHSRTGRSIFIARRYTSAVLGVVILSVRPFVCPSVRLSHACFVSNPKNLPTIFYTVWKGSPSSFLPPSSGWWATSSST